ncbi:MAG: cytochrome c biogenesis protein CcsA [Acidobacteria bacterium]|nr:cytochrome c biogenesis protein CcsA [Acidobacteriota bacterium]
MTPRRITALAWIAGLAAVLFAALAMLPPKPARGFDLAAFARIPVLEGGRVKPIDSVARNSLLMIRSKQSFQVDGTLMNGVMMGGRTVTASEWLLDVMFRPQVADKQPVFVIDDPDVLGLIGMKQSSNRYFSLETLQPFLNEIERQAQAAQPVEPRARSRYQSAVANLYERLYLYWRLRNTVQNPEASGGLAGQLAGAAQPSEAMHQETMIQLAHFRPLPPLQGQSPDAWLTVGQALRNAAGGQANPGLTHLAGIASGYGGNDPAAFNRAVGELTALASTARPEAISHASHELLFNRAQPFYNGMIIYILALLGIFAYAFMLFFRPGHWFTQLAKEGSFALLVAGSVVHTAGLISRTILQGRPPVTNLYSSAIFVGWGAVILGLVLERMYRKGFATAVAAASGFASLIVAHHLSMDGDTMEMMRAVLDSNFWLATHVVTITIGYSGVFLAGSIAIGYTLWKHIVKNPEPETERALSDMTYGVICFSLFFSFIGTVLGGIWADQSWGRFWGWDPKENGALLIVLWCSIILHARWAGYARDRGIMAMAIFGNIVTSFSWFGVNMLGVGLHSYGFMDKAFVALILFCVSQLVLIGLCLLPRRFWENSPDTPRAKKA